MKNFGKISPILIMTALLILSCSEDLSLLPDNQDEAEVVIRTIAPGKIVGPEGMIPLEVVVPNSLRGTDQAPDSLTVELRNPDGELVANTKFPEQSLSEGRLPSLSLPEALPNGLYTLVFKLYRQSVLTQETSVQFFCDTGSVFPNGIASYPPSLYPGASCLLDAVLSVTDDSDPYLVWKSGERVLFSGTLSKGLSRVEWVAPAAEGVYNVRLDVYPVAPANGTEYSFPSPLYTESKIFVTKKPTPDQYDLPGGTGYLSLFHFRGDLRDEGYRAESDSGKILRYGKPVLAKGDGIFGYRLDGAGGFSIPAFLLPSRNGRLTPFSLELRLKPEPAEDTAERVLFSSTSGSLSFSVRFGKDGAPYLEFSSGSLKVDSMFPLSLSETDEPVSLALSILPEASSTVVFWYLNGELLFEDVLEFDATYTPAPGVTVIGASADRPGFRGIIDEFGVFTRDEQGRPDVDPDIFLRAKTGQYGRDLLFAESFDSIYLPDWIGTGDKTVVERGMLIIPSGSLIGLPPLSAEEGFTVEVSVPDANSIAGGYLVVSDPETSKSLRIPLSSLKPVRPSVLRADIRRDDSGFRLLQEKPAARTGTASDETGDEPPGSVQVGIGNSSSDADKTVRVDSIIAVKFENGI